MLIAGIVVLIIAQIVALSPSSLEQPQTNSEAIPQQVLVKDYQEPTLAKGIPTTQVPDYSIERFNYVSTKGSDRQWKLVADRAFFYTKENLVLGKIATADLYDSQGQVTIVAGKEAKYFTHDRDLEVFGDVVARFPDGFVMRSQYLRYRPNLRRIEVPTSYPVEGGGLQPDGQRVDFKSMGLEVEMGKSLITLPQAAWVKVTRPKSKNSTQGGETIIESDRCEIDRLKHIAHFTMYASRASDVRFVRASQPDMFARSRRMELHYGEGNGEEFVDELIAREDVLIRELGNSKSLRYGTGGRADFDGRRNVIVLREFPQVYQDRDTVTGDVIVVHRDTDIVEVEHSNAFSTGQEPVPSEKNSR